MTGFLGLAPKASRKQLALAAAPALVWGVAWVGWVLYRHAQPLGVSIEWLLIGAFGAGPLAARSAALGAGARAPGRVVLAIELAAIFALALGWVEVALALGFALSCGLCARGQGGPEAAWLDRLGRVALLGACVALAVGFRSNRPSMEPRLLLALPLVYEAVRGPSGADAGVRRIAGAIGIAVFALCRYQPLWGVLLGGWVVGCAGFALRGGGRRRALRLGAPLAIALLGTVALDLGLRLTGRVGPAPPSPTGDALFDPARVPVWTGVGPDGEAIENPIHWNDPPLGIPMHDVDRALEKPAGVQRVVVLGDSFVEGVHVPIDALFHRQLEVALDRPERQVECVSQAHSGWGQLEELAQLREVGLRYAPDLVLVEFLPFNDVRDNSAELEHAVEAELVRASWARPLQLDAARKGLAGVAKLAELLDRLWRRVVAGDADWLEAQVYRERPTRVPELWAAAWTRTEHLLLELRAEAQNADARLGVVIFPSQAELDSELGLGYPARRIRAFCEANRIPVLDLTPVFAADPDRRRAYLKYDKHWSTLGHARAAAATATWIEEAGLLR